MRKYRLTLQQLAATFWLSAVTALPGAVRAADQRTPPVAVTAETSPPAHPSMDGHEQDGQEQKPARLVPEQFSQMFKIDDDHPEAKVPTVKDRISNPMEFGYYVQDLLTRAEVEEKRNNPMGAIKYYRALAVALPEEARTWALVCNAYDKVHDRDRAWRACKYAIERKGAELKDFEHYVALMTAKQGELLPEERNDLNDVLAHLDQQPDLAVPTAHLRCQVAVKTNDAAALESCTGVLAKVAPDDPKTIVFRWSLAVMRGDREQAANLYDRARQIGLAAASLDRMSQVPMGHWWSTRGRGLVGMVVAAGAALLFALAFALYRRRLTAATRRLAP
jgi:hypothetical protein